MQIRHMRSADLDAVSALVGTEAAPCYTTWDWTERAAVEPDTLLADLKRAHSESFVAESESGTTIGYAYASVRRGALWLDRLIVTSGGDATIAANLLHAVIINYVGEPSIAVAVARGETGVLAFFEGEGFAAFGSADDRGTVSLRRPISRA